MGQKRESEVEWHTDNKIQDDESEMLENVEEVNSFWRDLWGKKRINNLILNIDHHLYYF